MESLFIYVEIIYLQYSKFFSSFPWQKQQNMIRYYLLIRTFSYHRHYNSTLLLFLQDPCTSFYAFSCGGWMSRNPPPPRRMVHSVMSEMRDKIDLKLKGTKIQIHTCTLFRASKKLGFQYY